MKFLLTAIAVYALFWLVRRSWRGVRRRVAPAPMPMPRVPEPMLRCAECGLHLPRQEALVGPDGVFCGAAHRDAHARRSTG